MNAAVCNVVAQGSVHQLLFFYRAQPLEHSTYRGDVIVTALALDIEFTFLPRIDGDVILSGEEFTWLSACWLAATGGQLTNPAREEMRETFERYGVAEGLGGVG